MKSIFMLAGAGAFALLVSGCAPELDQTGLSPEEQQWAADIKANYGAWNVPESVPRSVRRDDVAAQNTGSAAAAQDDVNTASVPAAAAEPAPVAEPAAVAPAPEVAVPEFYTVVKGDTLSAIAQKFYGKASAWKRIQEANADLLKGKDLIRPGMKLQIPRP